MSAVVVGAIVGSLVLVGLAALALSLPIRRGRRERAAHSGLVMIGDNALPLDAATWALASILGPERVGAVLCDRQPKTGAEASRVLQEAVDHLSDADREVVLLRASVAERARASKALWEAQTEITSHAAVAGALDSLVVAAATDPWATNLMEGALQHVDASQFVLTHLIGHFDHSAYFHQSLIEPGVGAVDHFAGGVVDAGLGAGEHLLGAVAQAHVPVITITRSIHRAVKSSQNGLDSSRVNENLAIDMVAKGGGFWGGAHVGAAVGSVVPGPGTLVGGIVGGVLGLLAGNALAEDAKGKHLRVAIQEAHRATADVGASIDPEAWAEVVTEAAAQHYQQVCNDYQALGVVAREAKSGLLPSLVYYILVAAGEVGYAAVMTAQAEHICWRQAVQAETDHERGVAIMLRRDLSDVLIGDDTSRVDRALSAHAQVGEERRMLALAAG